jgi:hypothetical protein
MYNRKEEAHQTQRIYKNQDVENQGKKQQNQQWSKTKRMHEQGSYHVIGPEQEGEILSF